MSGSFLLLHRFKLRNRLIHNLHLIDGLLALAELIIHWHWHFREEPAEGMVAILKDRILLNNSKQGRVV